MRAIIQRTDSCSVSVNDAVIAEIQTGLLVLLGIEDADSEEDADWLSKKISAMRIFPDADNAMNLSVLEVGGDIIVVSQFTLHASTKKGNRPSFIRAAKPDVALPLYRYFNTSMEKEIGKAVQTGEFGAMMKINLVNNGPVTICMDSKNKE